MGKMIFNPYDETLTSLEGSVIIETEDFTLEDEHLMADYLETENYGILNDLANRYGKPIKKMLERNGYGDVSYLNSITYSPRSLRDEAEVILEVGAYDQDPETKRFLEWAKSTATNDELDDVAQYILNHDEMFSGYKDNFISGLIWFGKENKL